MKFIRPVLWIILLSGLAGVIFGSSMPLYTDAPAFRNCYEAISFETDGQQVAAERFKLCREQFLSLKISVIRYSATFCLLAGFGLILIALGGRNIRAPRRRWIVISMGLAAAIATGISSGADLMWNASLETYPHWADSIAIPMAAIPVLILFGLIVWGINVFLIRKRVVDHTESIFATSWKRQNKFLLAEVFVAALLALDAVIFGDFFSLIPSLIWLSFFTFVMAWRNGPIEQAQ